MARVCMVAFTYYPTDTRVRREAEALASRGDFVEVISLGKNGGDHAREFNGIKLIQLSLGRYRGSSALIYLLNYILFFIAATFWLTLLHSKHPFQIIQVHTMPDFMVFVAIIPKFLGAKVILDVHDLMPELYQSKFGLDRNHLMIRLITWIERCSIGFADRAIAVHQPHLEALIRHGNPADKFITLLNLPDPKIFSNKAYPPPTANSGFNLIYHGTVSNRHGLQIVLRAISGLKDEIKGLKFQIIGEGDGVQDLINLANELELSEYVNLRKGFVPLEELIPIIMRADVGVVPILYDEFTKYMLPTKLLEYVALNKPVICSRTETIQAYFDDSMVQFIIPGAVNELIDKIRYLYQNPEKRKQLVINAEAFNRNYNWHSQKLLYYRTIDGLTKSNPGGEAAA